MKSSFFLCRLLVVSCVALVALLVSPALYSQTRPNIISWGENISSWNEQLGVLGLREGCSIYPTSCEPYLDNLANLANVKTYYVSMPFSATESVAWAKEYSTLSLSHKMMVAIGFDDFVNKIENDQIAGTLPNPAAFVTDVIAATKSANPNLAFGVTIYEDGLTHAALLNLPVAVRSQIQYVHLYLHYRENAPNYASYVATAKTIFPKAKIIAGAYPYDRIDYLPCAFKGTVHCTAAQEQALYKQALQIQLNLLNAGTIYGLEFFFGYFGDPQDWPSWTSETRICQPARLSTCYENSTILQKISLEVLHSKLTPAVSLPHTSLYMGSEPVGKQGTPGKMVMTNSGGGPLAISSIGVAGINKTEFPLTHNCPTTLAAGASCTLTIYFKPAGTGTRDGEIVIMDNAGSGTQYVTLTGTGTASTGTASTGTAAVSLSHTSLYMGSQILRKKGTPGNVTITNKGSGSLVFSSVVISGANAADFSRSFVCPATLTAGSSCILSIYFTPSALGARSATISIKDTAGTQSIALTGTGIN
jgi:hypothetical protein